VGQAGATPLAPTKPTHLTTGLELRRQGCAETELSGVGCELAGHLLVSLHFELGEQR
jgi:hypothetical protein